MAYQPGVPPANATLEDVIEFLKEELVNVARAMNEVSETQLIPQAVAPEKPRSGMVVQADGANWNPGSGEGAYVFYAAAWHFLG